MMTPAINDPLLGRLAHDAELGWYEGQGHWDGQAVTWSVSGTDDAEVAAALAVAHALQAEPWRERLEAALVAELLPLKNDSWLDEDEDEDEAPVDAAGFLRRIAVEGITTHPDGTAEIYWEDGDLFLGHTLVATLTPATGEIAVTLAG